VTPLVACGQFTPAWGDTETNLAVMIRQAREAAGRGAGIIVFPEMCLTGYIPPEEVRETAMSPGARPLLALAETAAALGLAMAFGYPHKTEDGRFFNSMAFLDARGRTASVYRKVHLFGREAEWAEPGDGFSVFDAGPFRCGMWICYDSRFPEAARALALSGASAALVASAWLGPADEWELAVRARAMDNGLFVAAAALQGVRGAPGSPGHMALHGASLIADPHGRVLARAAEGRDEVILASYDAGEQQAFRRRLPLLSHRRPGAYGALDRAADWP
jgi:5-aminopentanamidase